eukprot:tig00000607_g2518.t1
MASPSPTSIDIPEDPSPGTPLPEIPQDTTGPSPQRVRTHARARSALQSADPDVATESTASPTPWPSPTPPIYVSPIANKIKATITGYSFMTSMRVLPDRPRASLTSNRIESLIGAGAVGEAGSTVATLASPLSLNSTGLTALASNNGCANSNMYF